MAITPAPGWQVNAAGTGVVPIGTAASVNSMATPTTGITAIGSPTITKTSTTPTSNVVPGTTNTVNTTPTGSVPNTSYQSGSIGPGNTPYTPAPTSVNYTTSGAANDVINQNLGYTAPASSTVNPTTSNTTTYPGLVSNLVNSSLGGNSTANTAATGLVNLGNTNSLTSSPAYQNYLTTQQQIQNIQGSLAKTNGNLETGDQALPVVLGQEGALAKQYGGQLSALQTQAAAQLGLAEASTQQQATQQNALSNAGSVANTSQGLTQSGLTSAISASAPTGNYPFVFNPLTGTYTSGVNGTSAGGVTFTGNPTTDAQTAAQAVISGKMTYAQAQSSMSYVGSTADNYLNSAIINAGGNPETLQAQGAATQSNVQTQGTAQTSIASQGLSDATAKYTDATTYNNTASNQAGVLQQVLQTTGINSGVPAYNKAVNSLQSQMGGTNYASFITALSELQNSYSQLLSTGGGTPTSQDATALATLNPSSSAQQINASISTLENDAYAKLSSLYGNVQTYQGMLGGNSTSAPTSSTGSGTSVGGYTFTQDANGNWVAQ